MGQNNVPPDWAGWKRDLLAQLDAPLTPANDAFLNAWARREGGGGQNNPFNTTYALAGATNLAGNSAKVKNYPIPHEGAVATALTLKSSYYRDVLGDLRAGKASTSHCYKGLHTWSGGGYCSLSGTPTAPPTGSSGTGVVGDPMADQGFGPAYDAAPYTCNYRTHWELPTSPWSTEGVTICWDKPVSLLLMAAGGVLVLSGVAVLLVGAFAETRAGAAAASAATAVGGPATRITAAAAAQRPAARAQRRTEADQTRDAAEARRLAPVRAEQRRQEAHDARMIRSRAATQRAVARGSGRTYDAGGPSTRTIVRQNRERNARRDAAAARRDDPAPF